MIELLLITHAQPQLEIEQGIGAAVWCSQRKLPLSSSLETTPMYLPSAHMYHSVSTART